MSDDVLKALRETNALVTTQNGREPEGAAEQTGRMHHSCPVEEFVAKEIVIPKPYRGPDSRVVSPSACSATARASGDLL